MFGKKIARGRNSGLKCLSTGSLPTFPFPFLAIFSPNREPVHRLRLGTIIQIIFCAQSGASIGLTVWKWSGESRYPGAFKPVLENVRRPFSSRPWVSEDGIGEQSRESKTLFLQYFANLAVLACSRRSYGGEVSIFFHFA